MCPLCHTVWVLVLYSRLYSACSEFVQMLYVHAHFVSTFACIYEKHNDLQHWTKTGKKKDSPSQRRTHASPFISSLVCHCVFLFPFFLLLFLFVLCTAKCVMNLLLLLVGGVCANVHVVMATFVVGNTHRIGCWKTSMLKSGSLPFMFDWCSVWSAV